ncbi:MAG: hypothetical protein QXF12_01530 [Candidatus Aenigmatarchaeota archaeon]
MSQTMKNINDDNSNLENLILRYNFILSNIYFLFNNLNYGFYLSLIEKIGESLEKENNEILKLLKECFKILNITEILKKDFDFLEKECEKMGEILYEIRYDLENIRENSNNIQLKQLKKVENTIKELDTILDIIRNNIQTISEIKKITTEDLLTNKGIRKFSILLLDLKKKINEFI